MSAEAIFAATIIGVIVVGVLILYAVLTLFGGLFRLAIGSRDHEPSLAERVDANRAPRTWFGQVDKDFERLIRGTLLGISTERAIEILLLIGAVVGVLCFVLTGEALLAVGGLFIGGLIALLVYIANQNRWRIAIQDQLPDGCFQLSRCLRAGLNLPDAMRETGEYIDEPLGPIFRKIGVWTDAGMPIPDAMDKMASDVQLTDFDTLSAVVNLQSEYGGNLPALLDRLAAAIRDRNQFRGYFRAVTSLSRATSLFVAAAAPVAVILYLIFQPVLFMNFLDTTRGQITLAVAVVLEIVGLIWIFWLLSRQERY